MIRRKGVGFISLLVIVLLSLSMLISDQLIERIMESTGSAVVGAKVEFDGVDFSPFFLRLRWQKLQVANPTSPMRNLFETGFCDLDLMVEPLLLKRFVVENMAMDSIRFDTQRENSGALRNRETNAAGAIERMQELLKNEIALLPVFDLYHLSSFDAESLLTRLELTTPQRVDSLIEAARDTIDTWRRRINRLSSEKKRIQQLKEDIESITVDTITSVERIRTVVERITVIKKRVDSLRTVIDSTVTSFENDIGSILNYETTIRQWISQDYQRVAALLQIPDITPGTIARALFGPVIINRIQSALTYIGIARYYGEKIQTAEPEKKEAPPRLRGQTIRFSTVRDWPAFWIKRIAASGILMETISISGLIRNIAAQQDLIGQPTVITLQGKQAGAISASLEAVFNYLRTISQESLELEVNQVTLDSITLFESSFLPLQLNQGTGSIAAALALNGDNLTFNGRFRGTDLLLDTPQRTTETNEDIADLYQSIISSVNSFTIQSGAQILDDQLSFTVSSNMSELITQYLRQFIQTQRSRIRAQVFDYVNEQLQTEQKTLQELTTSDVADLEKQIDIFNEQLDILSDLIAKKQNAVQEKARKQLFEKADESLEELF